MRGTLFCVSLFCLAVAKGLAHVDLQHDDASEKSSADRRRISADIGFWELPDGSAPREPTIAPTRLEFDVGVSLPYWPPTSAPHSDDHTGIPTKMISPGSPPSAIIKGRTKNPVQSPTAAPSKFEYAVGSPTSSPWNLIPGKGVGKGGKGEKDSENGLENGGVGKGQEKGGKAAAGKEKDINEKKSEEKTGKTDQKLTGKKDTEKSVAKGAVKKDTNSIGLAETDKEASDMPDFATWFLQHTDSKRSDIDIEEKDSATLSDSSSFGKSSLRHDSASGATARVLSSTGILALAFALPLLL